MKAKILTVGFYIFSLKETVYLIFFSNNYPLLSYAHLKSEKILKIASKHLDSLIYSRSCLALSDQQKNNEN